MARSGQAAVQECIHASVLCSVTDLSGLPLLYGISRSFNQVSAPPPPVEFWALLKTTARDLFSPLGEGGNRQPGPGKYLDQVDSTQFSFILQA